MITMTLSLHTPTRADISLLQTEFSDYRSQYPSATFFRMSTSRLMRQREGILLAFLFGLGLLELYG